MTKSYIAYCFNHLDLIHNGAIGTAIGITQCSCQCKQWKMTEKIRFHRQWWGQLRCLQQRFNGGKNGQVGMLKEVYQRMNVISTPKLTDFLHHLFKVGLASYTIGIYPSAILSFSELHHHHHYKTANHSIISKIIHHFYVHHPPSCKCFDPWKAVCLLSLLES